MIQKLIKRTNSSTNSTTSSTTNSTTNSSTNSTTNFYPKVKQANKQMEGLTLNDKKRIDHYNDAKSYPEHFYKDNWFIGLQQVVGVWTIDEIYADGPYDAGTVTDTMTFSSEEEALAKFNSLKPKSKM